MFDKLFITHSKTDYERIYEYLQEKRKDKKAIILEAIGDDWYAVFMIKYRYNKFIKINNYGNIEEVD